MPDPQLEQGPNTFNLQTSQLIPQAPVGISIPQPSNYALNKLNVQFGDLKESLNFLAFPTNMCTPLSNDDPPNGGFAAVAG